MPHAFHLPAQMAELLGDDSLTLEDLASACRVGRLRGNDAGLHMLAHPFGCTAASAGLVTWRFASTTLVRARRVADLESVFDADPHLAALTVDLMEEVGELRRQLRQLRPPASGA